MKVAPLNISQDSLFGILKSKAEIKDNIAQSLNENWDAESE